MFSVARFFEASDPALTGSLTESAKSMRTART